MPPAFNLSQDQTLQFDLFTSNSIDVGPIPIHIGYPSVDENKTCLHPCGLTRSGRSVFASCEHQNFLKCLPGFHGPRCCQRRLLWPGCPSTPVPTLIGCEFLKNRLARTDNRETPAERRDYTSKWRPVNTPSVDWSVRECGGREALSARARRPASREPLRRGFDPAIGGRTDGDDQREGYGERGGIAERGIEQGQSQ